MTKFINTIRAIIMFTLLLLVLIFCSQNSEQVAIHFMSMHLEQVPLFTALLGTLATGLLIGFLGGMITGSKSKREDIRKTTQDRDEKLSPTTEPDSKT